MSTKNSITNYQNIPARQNQVEQELLSVGPLLQGAGGHAALCPEPGADHHPTVSPGRFQLDDDFQHGFRSEYRVYARGMVQGVPQKK